MTRTQQANAPTRPRRVPRRPVSRGSVRSGREKDEEDRAGMCCTARSRITPPSTRIARCGEPGRREAERAEERGWTDPIACDPRDGGHMGRDHHREQDEKGQQALAAQVGQPDQQVQPRCPRQASAPPRSRLLSSEFHKARVAPSGCRARPETAPPDGAPSAISPATISCASGNTISAPANRTRTARVISAPFPAYRFDCPCRDQPPKISRTSAGWPDRRQCRGGIELHQLDGIAQGREAFRSGSIAGWAGR
jgi:hypothetical protein